MTTSCALVWFRDDLRLDDNPALHAAIEGGHVPIPIHVHAPDEEGPWAPGAASDAWRHRSLSALDHALRERGSRLHCFRGPTLQTLLSLIAVSGAEAVFWNRRYEPAIEQRDTVIKRRLRQQGVHAESFKAALLFEPWELQTGQGDPYRVFTPFWKSARRQWRVPRLLDAPQAFPPASPGLGIPDGIPVEALGLRPSLGWDQGFFDASRTPGEAGARQALDRFLSSGLDGYAAARDLPAVSGTSFLSAHLHFGELSVARIVHALQTHAGDVPGADSERFLAELGWREFAHHLLHHFPQTQDRDLNPRFQDFDWAPPRKALLDAWQQGRTGIPIVDAGMRQLWHTGWMHNRVRMIVASFLTKHLRMHWRYGAQWFWDTLVDADLANNTLGWQWSAGTGADAAPYFRVFNPVLQARRFDEDAAYIGHWVPELQALPPKARFAPWQSPGLARRLAPAYPATPIVDLDQGRAAALEAYQRLKSGGPAAS